MFVLGLNLVIDADKAVIGQYQLIILTNQTHQLGFNIYVIKEVDED